MEVSGTLFLLREDDELWDLRVLRLVVFLYL